MFKNKRINMVKIVSSIFIILFFPISYAQNNIVNTEKKYISINEKPMLMKLWLANTPVSDDILIEFINRTHYKENEGLPYLIKKQYQLDSLKRELYLLRNHQYYSLQIDEPVFVRDDLAYTVRKVLDYNDEKQTFKLDIVPCGEQEKLKEIKASQGIGIFIKNNIFCDFFVDDPALIQKIETIKKSRRFDFSFRGEIYMLVSKDESGRLIGEVEYVDFSIYDKKNKETIYTMDSINSDN